VNGLGASLPPVARLGGTALSLAHSFVRGKILSGCDGHSRRTGSPSRQRSGRARDQGRVEAGRAAERASARAPSPGRGNSGIFKRPLGETPLPKKTEPRLIGERGLPKKTGPRPIGERGLPKKTEPLPKKTEASPKWTRGPPKRPDGCPKTRRPPPKPPPLPPGGRLMPVKQLRDFQEVEGSPSREPGPGLWRAIARAWSFAPRSEAGELGGVQIKGQSPWVSKMREA
jgi:hypothetical protein